LFGLCLVFATLHFLIIELIFLPTFAKVWLQISSPHFVVAIRYQTLAWQIMAGNQTDSYSHVSREK
jgi:hypothetical protein